MISEITLKRQPRYSKGVELSGVNYFIDVNYNTKTQRWYFSLQDSQKNVIVRNVKLVLGRDLLLPFRSRNIPPGMLFVVRRDSLDRDPNFSDIPDKARLLYNDEV